MRHHSEEEEERSSGMHGLCTAPPLLPTIYAKRHKHTYRQAGCALYKGDGYVMPCIVRLEKKKDVENERKLQKTTEREREREMGKNILVKELATVENTHSTAHNNISECCVCCV